MIVVPQEVANVKMNFMMIEAAGHPPLRFTTTSISATDEHTNIYHNIMMRIFY